MSRTILLEQIDVLDLESEIRKRLEKLAGYRAADGFSISFSFYDYPAATGEEPLDFAISVQVTKTENGEDSFETFGSFKFDEVPLIAAEVARRGDMEIYYRSVEKRMLETLKKLREVLVEPFLSPMEKHLLELSAFDNFDLACLEFDEIDLDDWPHEPRIDN